MTIDLKDLVTINFAAQKMAVGLDDILFDALDGKLELFALSSVQRSIIMIPCKNEWIEEERFNVEVYSHTDYEAVDIELGQALKLNNKAIKGLIVNKSFIEVELFRALPTGQYSEYDFWRTSEELNPHIASDEYATIDIDSIFLHKKDINTSSKVAGKVSVEAPSNTSLKVIALLMHHLAKSPKYASGTSPNKSQIKELLLELAVELDVNNYGLSKVDERLLAEAMKYLETQKN